MSLPACEPPAVVDSIATVGVSAFGHQLGGMGVVTLADRWSLTLLSPAGVELFTVQGPPTEVAAGFPEWEPWLQRMPFERDLRLVYTVVPEGGCTVGEGTAGEGSLRWTHGGERLTWRGPDGRAWAIRGADRVEVHDPRRRYLLTVKPADAPR